MAGKRLVAAAIVSVTFLASIAIPLGSKQVSLGVLIPMFCALIGFGLGRMQLRAANLVAYAAAMSIILALQIIGGGEFSALSLLLLAALHLPYCFQLSPDTAGPEAYLALFQKVAVVLAVCGLCQFGGQFIVDYRWLFPIQTFLPQSFVLQNYNYFNPLFPGSAIFKSNGVFMLEASYFSQLAALALIIEILYFRRLLAAMLFLAALVVAYSGSGLLVLIVALPFIVITKKRYDILLYALVVLVAGYALSDTLGLNLFVNRAGELADANSSGFARFVGGFYLFNQYLWPDTTHALFGMGAGAMDRYADQAQYAVAAVTWVKAVFEYGLVGAVVYFAFQYFCLFANRGPLAVKLAIAVMLQLNGSLVPFAHALIFALLVWPADQPSAHRNAGKQPRRRRAAAPAIETALP
jgi:hypothetical protein